MLFLAQTFHIQRSEVILFVFFQAANVGFGRVFSLVSDS